MPSKKISQATLLALLPSLTLGLPSSTPALQTVFQFENPTWLENLAVRANGDVLVTKLAPEAQVWQITNPLESGKTDASLIHTFGSVGNILGITETTKDVFVVATVNVTAATVAVPGTAQAWKIDLRSSHESAKVTKVADLPASQFVNGVASLPKNKDVVLIADSTLGCVWRVDTCTGKVVQVLKYSEMAPVPNQLWQIGINGIHVRDDYLYWTNSFKAAVYRLRIDPRHGDAAPGASVELVTTADNVSFIDDFAIDASGGIYAPAGINNTIVYAPPHDQHAASVVGSQGSFDVAGGTGVAFARNKRNGKTDYHTLYVVTSGALGAPVNGTLTEGGKIVAYRT